MLLMDPGALTAIKRQSDTRFNKKIPTTTVIPHGALTQIPRRQPSGKVCRDTFDRGSQLCKQTFIDARCCVEFLNLSLNPSLKPLIPSDGPPVCVAIVCEWCDKGCLGSALYKRTFPTYITPSATSSGSSRHNTGAARFGARMLDYRVRVALPVHTYICVWLHWYSGLVVL